MGGQAPSATDTRDGSTRSGWRVQRELGIDYLASADRTCLPGQPVYAERGEDGGHLVVFEVGAHKWIPQRSECCTLWLDSSSRPVYDTRTHGIRDGFGVLNGSAGIAVVRRTTWELLIVEHDGNVADIIDLSPFSKHVPRVLARADDGTFLVALLTDLFQMDLIELDGEGRLLWYCSGIDARVGYPSSIQKTASGNILLADEFCHQVVEIDREGKVVWRFGETGNPGMKAGLIAGPRSARELAPGTRLVTDSRNNRLLSTRGTAVDETVRTPLPLCGPSFADRLPNGNTLICDSGNDWVFELDGSGSVVWQLGEPVAKRRSLSFPRSAQLTPGGTLLVADTANDRIVEFTADGREASVLPAEQDLFWPRCARNLPGDTFLLADSRQSRVVEVDRKGRLLRELSQVREGDEIVMLSDPHDVRGIANDELLIVDSPLNVVLATHWDGTVSWSLRHACGTELRDPHSAQQLEDGRVLVSDTGNHRVVIADPVTGQGIELTSFVEGAERLRFHHPRYAEMTDDGVLVIVDAGNNRVLAGTPDGVLLWQIAEVAGSPLPSLAQPRWLELRGSNEIYVVDHRQHRIVHFVR